jgi:hypothetical protein
MAMAISETNAQSIYKGLRDRGNWSGGRGKRTEANYQAAIIKKEKKRDKIKILFKFCRYWGKGQRPFNDCLWQKKAFLKRKRCAKMRKTRKTRRKKLGPISGFLEAMT